MPTQPPSDLVRSVSRAFRVLEEVGRHPCGVSAKRVARRCELRLSTAYHLLRTLRYEGYVECLPSGDYVLGLKIADRFRDLAGTLQAPPEAGQVLRDLATVTGHSAYLARFVRGVVTLTDVAEAPGSPHLEDLLVGFHEGAHATALGKALLSTLSPRQRQTYLREHGMRPYTHATIRDLVALESELATASEGGVYVEEGQYRTSVSCAAMLTCDRGEWQAIALSARLERLRQARRPLLTALAGARRDLRPRILDP
jgi:DNA-binding IclR family transcriptional regulator